MGFRKTAGDLLKGPRDGVGEGDRLQEEGKPNRPLGKQEKNAAKETRGPQIKRGQGRK